MPELKKAISIKKNLLDTTLADLEIEQPKWDEIRSKKTIYETMQTEMFNAISKEEAFKEKAWDKIREERDKRFAIEHPEYTAFKSEYDTEYKIHSDLCTKRDKLQSFIEEIQSYLKKIEKHQDYLAKNNIAA